MDLETVGVVTGLSMGGLTTAAARVGVHDSSNLSGKELGLIHRNLAKNGGYNPDALAALAELQNKRDSDRLPDMGFEDRIAQLVMAVLYSASHIEVTAQIGTMRSPPTQNDITAGKDALKTRQKELANAHARTVENIARVAGISWNAIDHALVPLQIKLGPGEELTQAQLGRLYRFLKQHGGATPRGLQQLEFVIDTEAEILLRGAKQNPAPGINPIVPVSEIDYDTTAAAIHDDVIMFACNFKRRQMGKKISFNDNPGYSYVDFGSFTPNSINLVQQALSEELLDVRANGTGVVKHRADAIKHCHILGTSQRPTDRNLNSRPHAEMQILQFLNQKGWTSDGSVAGVGVSRPCCPRCAGEFHRIGLNYTRVHDITPRETEWLEPKSLDIASLRVFPVA